MIDIHSHVLFGLDDGARTLDDSLAMLRMAAEHGTTDIVATPHASPQYRFDPSEIADRAAQITEARAQTEEKSPKLHLGCDFHLSFDNIEDAIAHPSKYTINGNNYVMVEFSDLMVFPNTAEIFERLRDAGMVPVITHPERNALLRQRLDEIARWVEKGARVQVTAQSLGERFGKKAREFSKTLLDEGLVHVIASDGHDCVSRPPIMDQAFEWLAKNYGEGLAVTLCIANPGATLTGQAMELPEKPAARKWYQVW